ncbi:DUF3817 domain-containing protein [Myroides pelagicus]|uniref:DUF3817 domain-containing protein n=1 Tax=Myroides pelagicus TaxID=270914 RepID=A0A7K1GKW0_9FLAO|nr:DUF3817 domain-containing protein [Myroides pelagicus]MTH29169.1 DUF3817 domain-containing protein [Myroides pelagicus]
MLKTFKFIALLEGLSLLVLLFIAMPLKYIWDKPELVRSVGMIHGILFIAYIVIATVIKSDEKWSMKTYGLICIASVIPFGTFVMEKKLLEKA